MELKLIDFEPRWTYNDTSRTGMGVSFRCPCCRLTRIIAWFENPLDGKKPWLEVVPEQMFKREGETFETLTLNGTIALKGHWRGTLRQGLLEGEKLK